MQHRQSPIVSILLRHFNWNNDRLIERFFESASRVLKDAGEPASSAENVSDVNPRPAKRVRLESPFPPPTEYMCPVCCDDEPSAVFRLRCNHAFCTSCWKDYVTSKIKDEGQCTFPCMHDDCRTVVDSRSIAKLVEPSVNARLVAVSSTWGSIGLTD